MSEPIHPLEWKLGAELWAELTAPSPGGSSAPNFPPAAKVRRMADWLWLHAPEMIAAIRPKCEKCGGRGQLGGMGDDWPCDRCNGMGWAA